MACGYPLNGHYSSKRNIETGKRSVIFTGKDILTDCPITVRCGQCLGCRIENAKQYAIRCMHEAHYYDNNIFVTLTFNNEHLAEDKSLHKEDFQNFMKRLRKKYVPQRPDNWKQLTDKQKDEWSQQHEIRYFHCGEYGTSCKTCGYSPNSSNNCKRCFCGERYIKTCGRPHHHALIFNLDFTDKEFLKYGKNGTALYTSETLERIWGKGNVTIGEVTFESASYVAQYVTKKQKPPDITGRDGVNYRKKWEEYYEGKQPEYVTMSRRPGLGFRFYNEFKDTDMFNQDYIYINGQKLGIPKYYDRRYALDCKAKHDKLKAERKQNRRNNPDAYHERNKVYNFEAQKYKFNKYTERQLDHES